MTEGGDAVRSHYSAFSRRDAILASVAAAGKNPDAFAPEDIATFDQLHTAGHTATSALMTLLSPQASMHVLDVGCGIGGPARQLSSATQCSVTGIDLTPEFIATADDLTARTRQTDKVKFQVASATDLPFADHTFDAAWHIHMNMNVADKARMYREIFRALKPGARFALYDPVRGPGPAPTYPVPWAATPATSFLLTQTGMRQAIEAAGFQTLEMKDSTQDGLSWYAALAQDRGSGKPPMQLQQDPRLIEMSKNHRTNLESGAIRIMCALFQRP